jgi:hypothetical protein
MKIKDNDEIIVVTKNHVLCDVLVNGKPAHLYTVVPKEELRKYLRSRGWLKKNDTSRPVRQKH